ncbi:MAG TPA: Ig-like domain-containing protein [Acidimicrobiia bacterium]|nr:Ig-like domain-containing protein [Acidimicrobiia bacterium]
MTEAHHYFDERDQPLPEWDGVWRKLAAFFGSDTPPHITLKQFSGNGGRFDGRSQTIVISDTAPAKRVVQIVAHESAHLGLYRVTRGASATEPFRFFDEGYSDIVGKTIAGENMTNHKRFALAIASAQVKARALGFAQVQNWSSYAGNLPSQGNDYAYPVGSSFVYFVIDSFGEKRLFDFFRDVGETRDLDLSFQQVFGLGAAAAEQRWKDYVVKEAVPEAPLTIIEMVPANNSTDIPIDIAELHVKFSVPMMPTICVSTPCGNTGVCYTNASWTDDRTLVIRTDSKLLPGATYKLALGSDAHRCHLTSVGGARLPTTPWVFTTKKADSTPLT